jgi:tRNA A37 methylthiotransferase MiaB
MRRGYTREAYIQLVDNVRRIFGNRIALSSDFIAGFCGETEEEHQDTLSLMRYVKYNFCFMFPYSMREKTKAYHRLKDDVPSDVKARRHTEVTNTFREIASELNASKIGQIHLVLIEGESKRSSEQLAGRNDNNTTVILDKCKIPLSNHDYKSNSCIPQPGDYVACKIIDSTSQTLRAKPLYFSSITDFEF